MQQQEAISLKPQSIQATIQHTYDALNLYVVKEQRHNAAKKGTVHSIKKAPSFAQKEGGRPQSKFASRYSKDK